jgi:hypothetical protein
LLDIQPRQDLIGEVRCLNCSRSLAQLVRGPDGRKFTLLPAVNRSSVQVIVAGRRLLRCGCCGGRAFVEIREDTPVEIFVATSAALTLETSASGEEERPALSHHAQQPAGRVTADTPRRGLQHRRAHRSQRQPA